MNEIDETITKRQDTPYENKQDIKLNDEKEKQKVVVNQQDVKGEQAEESEEHDSDNEFEDLYMDPDKLTTIGNDLIIYETDDDIWY